MNEEQLKLARHRLLRARSALAAADSLIQAGYWADALNRLYYAVLYAARALLATADVATSSHTGAARMFHKHFVKNGQGGRASWM